MNNNHTATTDGRQVTGRGVLLGSGRATIYGNYVAPAVASTHSPWHIQGEQPDLAFCGKRLHGPLRQMHMHVSLLECSRCMAKGATHPEAGSVTPTG